MQMSRPFRNRSSAWSSYRADILHRLGLILQHELLFRLTLPGHFTLLLKERSTKQSYNVSHPITAKIPSFGISRVDERNEPKRKVATLEDDIPVMKGWLLHLFDPEINQALRRGTSTALASTFCRIPFLCLAFRSTPVRNSSHIAASRNLPCVNKL